MLQRAFLWGAISVIAIGVARGAAADVGVTTYEIQQDAGGNTGPWTIADLESKFFWLTRIGGAPPSNAIVYQIRWSINIDDTGAPGFFCGDYEIYLSNDTHQGVTMASLVYDNLGTQTDDGHDDDTANDSDIWINVRTYHLFDGEPADQGWMIYVKDVLGGGSGQVIGGIIDVYWQSPPPKPTNINATNGEYTNEVLVTWTDVPGETSYRVYRGPGSGGPWSSLSPVLPADQTQYHDTSVECGSPTYYYTVRAFNEAGGSGLGTPDDGYTAQCPQQQVATPNISPASGAYSAPLTVTISCDTAGATIRYTDNGNEPTEQSTIIGSGSQIQVNPPVTIKAKAWKAGTTVSDTANRNYTLPQQQVATPIITPASGPYGAPLTVTISCDTAGTTIRYTDNGNEPTEQSTIIGSGSEIQVNPPVTIKAKAWKAGMTASDTAVRDYSLPQDVVADPAILPQNGTYDSPLSVSITCATSGATIRYTIDGGDPNESAPVYTGSFQIMATNSIVSKTVKARAYKPGNDHSQMVFRSYTVTPAGALDVTSPNGGEKWKKGSDYKIRWNSQNLPGKVTLELYRNGNFVRVIKSKARDDGKLKWSVPVDSNLATGFGYTVRVTSISNPDIWDESDGKFTISSTKRSKKIIAVR